MTEVVLPVLRKAVPELADNGFCHSGHNLAGNPHLFYLIITRC